MIHVSDLIAYQRCPRFAYNQAHNKEPFQGFYHLEAPFSTYWMEYYGIQDAPSGQVGDTNEDSLKLLEESEIVINIRFEYKGCRTRIPILKKVKGGYCAIYPHLTAYPKESEAFLIKCNKWIAKSVGIEIIENKIFYLNKDYVRQGDLDVFGCFLETDQLCNRKNKLNKTIQEYMDELELDLDSMIEQVQECINQESAPIFKRSKKCTANRRCPHYHYCFDDNELPDNSILFLTTSQKKMEAFDQGIETIHELDLDQLDGFRLQYAQYIASQKGQFVDGWALHSWLSSIQYPISYLDFEWDTFAIPPYTGLKPFDVVCFQYSLHIEKKDEPLDHKDFFAVGDCRIDFIESLLKDIPSEGSILVYNMEGAEKLRLQQLSLQFPQYKEALDSICERMVDLSKPFEAGLFYDNRMRGHYSLKNVLPVFTDQYSYQQLNIQDGMDAVFSYRNYEQASKEEQKEIRNAIRNYCRMDTFAEYVIFQGLVKLDKEAISCQI